MKKRQYNIFEELIVDNFAGGGGASTGIELALGKPVDIAINHDKSAIEMHKKNHPFTQHFCEDVWQINPREVTGGRPVALAWFSPDCKHFSKAKGSTPVSKKIRGLAWVTLRWAATVKPRVIMLENVEEFMTWCPVKDGKPIKEKTGQTFNSFVYQLRNLGYAVEWKVLKACDYGAPTSRKRFFLIARCDGKPIIFPEKTHGTEKGLKPFRTAAECIDWSIPCKSIFGRKKSLTENTLKRIARGLDKFVIKSNKPFIIPVGYGENKGQKPRVHDIDKPLSTIVSTCKQNLCEPQFSPYVISNNSGNKPHSVEDPIPTVTTGIRNYLCASNLIQYHSEQSEKEVRGQGLDDPIQTVDGSNRYGLVAVNLSSRYGNGEDGRGKSLDSPLPTITATDHNEIVAANLIKYYSGDGHEQSAEEPLHTITEKPRFYLSEAICTMRNNMVGQPVSEPLSTITAKEHHALFETLIEKISDGNFGNWNEVRELLNKYAGYNIKEDEILILKFKDADYFISDIGMRMLEPHELAAAQGFPADYVLKVNDSYTKTDQIARIGNSVCPVMSKVLVQANLPELCSKKEINSMQELDNAIAS